jgi:hypothetical protein
MEERHTRKDFVANAGRALIGGAALLYGDSLLTASDALAASSSDVMTFVSRPDLRPPKIHITRHGEPAPGLLFLAPSSGPGERGAMIVDDDGALVWFLRTTPQTAMNLRVGSLHGRPVLSW